MSTALLDPPDLDSGGGGGIVARRAVIRWGWRLFRREWRQQLLVLGLLTVAIAATIWSASVDTNAQLPNPNYPTYGTAPAMAKLPGSDPTLAADIAAIQRAWGPADVIENQKIATGTTQSVQLRAENPHGHFNAPLVGLVSGSYPAGPGQVALTSGVAALYGAHVGGSWQAAGRTWRVTGIVANPSNLSDEFALVAPGQVSHPSQVIVLLGPAAAQLATNGDATLPGVPAAMLFTPNVHVGGFPRATFILVLEVLGLALIGLVSVASFSVMAQRRLRALGMLGAIGATERNLRLVMISGGLVVGATAALAGTAVGLAAWFAYAPTLQRASGHVVDAANLPWWAFAIAVVFAVATSVLASRRPAKTMAEVPVVTALSGRPAPPRKVHRSVLPGVIVFAFGLLCLAFAGGQAGPPGAGSNGPNPAGLLVLLGGLVGTIAGLILLAPLAISVLAPGADRRLPVAIRIALRDLVRYRARSGAALAAVTFAVFLATVICLVGSERTANPLNPSGPDLSSSQLVVTAGSSPAPGMMNLLTSAQEASLSRRLDSLAASLHARSAVPLENAAGLSQADASRHSNFTGSVYVATPQLLATYGIKTSQIAPGTDVLTSRPGLAGLSSMEMIWANTSCSGTCQGGGPPAPGASGGPPCTPSNDCLTNPTIQTVSNLPSGTDAPNTVITEYAVRTYHLQTQLTGWLIQAPAPLTAAQIRAARRVVLAYQAPLAVASGGTEFGEIAGVGTAVGIVIALGVLAASVGLIRSETAPDLRTLTATGASTTTRRTITAATAAALGLLGAILGMTFAVVASLVWAHGSLSALFGDVPLADVLILLLGLPLVAAAGGWLLAGREPPAVARQPME
jgi:putative ABC transport system permease protein